jgi:hypothetical protein
MRKERISGLGFGYLTALPMIFQLYFGDQFVVEGNKN